MFLRPKVGEILNFELILSLNFFYLFFFFTIELYPHFLFMLGPNRIGHISEITINYHNVQDINAFMTS